ncbi:type II toxin-antitoxin system RelE/ParE family toxin [Yinghuangia sp. YIM S10712]|uniref:type II toxin-antitoxin system RelE/ParE family toxin n=1 Tax=Yinghuangia sp. YIM S10712 TaxID=3436930 RepID=UPI003F52F327
MFAVEIEPSVRNWLGDARKVSPGQYRQVLRAVQRLKADPTAMGDMVKSLGGGLWELRLTHFGDISIRIPFWITNDKRIILLTVFEKTRQVERSEVEKARRLMRDCQAGCRGHEPATDEYRRFDDG